MWPLSLSLAVEWVWMRVKSSYSDPLFSYPEYSSINLQDFCFYSRTFISAVADGAHILFITLTAWCIIIIVIGSLIQPLEMRNVFASIFFVSFLSYCRCCCCCCFSHFGRCAFYTRINWREIGMLKRNARARNGKKRFKQKTCPHTVSYGGKWFTFLLHNHTYIISRNEPRHFRTWC